MKKNVYVYLAATALLVASYRQCSNSEVVAPRNTAQTKEPAPPSVAATERKKQTELETWEPTPEEKSIQEATVAVLHGKVVDEFGHPVPNAEIVCKPNNDPWINSLRRIVIRSDADGRFFLREANAASLSVSASAAGYYTSKASSGGYSFTDLPLSMPENLRKRALPKTQSSSENPVILTLRKMGSREPLLERRRSGVLQDTQTYLIGTTENHQIYIKYWLDTAVKRMHINGWPVHDWGVEISVKNGEIVSTAKPDSSNPASFMAPLDGYQAKIEQTFDSSMDDTKQKRGILGDFFVRFKDGTFARLELDLQSSPTRPWGIVASLYNPSGSRSTEFDPSIQIELPQNR